MLMLRYSLMMKQEKLVFRTFLDSFCLWLHCAYTEWRKWFSFSICFESGNDLSHFIWVVWKFLFSCASYVFAFIRKELYTYKYFQEAFSGFWLFDQTIIQLICICSFYNLETNQQGVKNNIFQTIFKTLLRIMRTWKNLKCTFLLQ
jgi:hypothetical protein